MSYWSTEPPTHDAISSWEATERRMQELREREAPYLDKQDEELDPEEWRNSRSYREQMEEARYYLRGERF